MNILNSLRYLIGWKTKRKIIVIESDDWGSERFPSLEVRHKYQNAGYPIEKCGFSMYDIVENDKDVSELLDLISGFKDSKGNQPKLTLFCNVANPDYQKILESDFEKYSYLSIEQTYKNYIGSEKVIELLKLGESNNLVELQFHGREHLYVNRWLRKLKENHFETLEGFKNRFFGFSSSYVQEVVNGYRAAYDLDFPEDLIFQKEIVRDGLRLFSQIFGKKASVFVAPDGPFNNKLEEDLFLAGIQYIGASRIQIEPLGFGKYQRKFHYLGQRNKFNQIYLTRTLGFEPISIISGNIDKAMKMMETSFAWNSPVVISTHRANYVSGLCPKNKQNGLKSLQVLLQKILQKWPEAEFMSSSELGDLIIKK